MNTHNLTNKHNKRESGPSTIKIIVNYSKLASQISILFYSICHSSSYLLIWPISVDFHGPRTTTIISKEILVFLLKSTGMTECAHEPAMFSQKV